MLETERLILRPFVKDDTAAVYQLRSDAEIMRFIREPQKTLAETENWIRLVSSRWHDEKIGFCAVVEKSSGKLIGWCGLWRLKETGETEIGYAISAEYQGLGLATEAAEVFLKYGFEKINAGKIVAVAHPDNKSSRRVMEKLGMNFEKIGKFYGANLAYYSIKRTTENTMETDKKVMFETERLIIRQMTTDDLPALVENRSDPEVYKYLGGLERQNSQALAKRLQFYIDCYEKHGFGMCATIWKETGEMIGTSGLQPLEDTGEIEVGYAVVRKFWRRGIAYESAKAWLEYGFEHAALERIVAVTSPDNAGSRGVMEKCGMKYEKTAAFYDTECVFYAISKKEFFTRFPE